MRRISNIFALDCACVMPPRGDARARAGAALVRVGVSE